MSPDIPQDIHGKELNSGTSHHTVSVDCNHIEKMLHVGEKDQFKVFCDEPDSMGGENAYPQPLTYIAMGIGF